MTVNDVLMFFGFVNLFVGIMLGLVCKDPVAALPSCVLSTILFALAATEVFNGLLHA